MDALSLPETLVRSRYVVRYQQKDITNDLTDSLIRLTYSDHLSGQSDEVELELEDVDGRWRDSWYPGKGDTLSVEIGWQGEPLVPCGRFVIDEIEFGGVPSVVSIRGLATGIQTAVRTTQHIAYEKTTLDGIARRVAQRLGLTLVGAIQRIPLERVTQSESDVAFLTKLASDYDYAFKIVGNQLVFHSIAELARARPVGTVSQADLGPGWRIRDQLKDVPAAVQVKSKNPGTGELVTYEMKNGEAVPAAKSSVKKATTSADTVKKTGGAATSAEAMAKAQADLARKNREQTQGSLPMQGRPRLVSGSVLALEGTGKLDGRYLVTASSHSLDRSGGYRTDVSVCRVRNEATVARTGAASGKPKPKRSKLAVYGMKNGQAVREN